MRAASGRQSKASMHASYTLSEYFILPGTEQRRIIFTDKPIGTAIDRLNSGSIVSRYLSSRGGLRHCVKKRRNGEKNRERGKKKGSRERSLGKSWSATSSSRLLFPALSPLSCPARRAVVRSVIARPTKNLSGFYSLLIPCPEAGCAR